jgi:hypothetical protein
MEKIKRRRIPNKQSDGTVEGYLTRRVMTKAQIREREEENQRNTAEAIRQRALDEST